MQRAILVAGVVALPPPSAFASINAASEGAKVKSD